MLPTIEDQTSLLNQVDKFFREEQARVLRSAPESLWNAQAHWSSWGIAACTLAFFAGMMTPDSGKVDGTTGKEMNWIIIYYSVDLGLLFMFTFNFWRRCMVWKRLLYTLQTGTTWTIIGYAGLVLAVYMGWPGANPWSQRLGAFIYFLLCVVIISLDACNCSRRFHLFMLTFTCVGALIGAARFAFFTPDSVVFEGRLTQAGWTGRLTRNGLLIIGCLGMAGVMLPALLSAWTDRLHRECYLLSEFMYKDEMEVT